MPPRKANRVHGAQTRGKTRARPKVADAKVEFKGKIPSAPSTTLIDAVRGLRNNETRVTVEVKGAAGKATSESKLTYPSELVAAFRGMFGTKRVYDFQLHQVLDVISSSGGSTLGYVSITPISSPPGAVFAEWSALSALFDEVKAIHTQIDWLSAISLASTINITVVMAFDEQNLATDPSSTLSVYRLAEARTFQSLLGEGGSGRHVHSHKISSRSWCNTAIPYSQSPIGGMVGSWVFGNDGLFSTSTTVAHVFSITVAKFRCRA